MSHVIHVNIDRLVLRGIDPANRQALVAGLRSELARILADPSTRTNISQSRRTPVLRLGSMALAPGTAGSRKFGSGLARAIGKGLQG